MNKENRKKYNFTGNLKQQKYPIHEPLEERSPFRATYLLLPEYEYILPKFFRIKFSKGKLNRFRFVICKRTDS